MKDNLMLPKQLSILGLPVSSAAAAMEHNEDTSRS